ncbi:hypothetical protein [Rufibacter hautae]|uniref:Uncharacterized protein n=1 Tax=Rufibacter hautae TaxID=2595005 RepID=A0A5B6TLH8_9BACT|nr:hypothetical protein [Rufibacter hautae]KAA3440289.1 hypothetical protein FOA19_06430 [Rufibacter hautae]
MDEDTHILLRQGWRWSLKPVYFMGFNISWLVMEEVFISPFDHQKYPFTEAMHLARFYQAWLNLQRKLS